jgi:D-methionine transport system permease protein
MENIAFIHNLLDMQAEIIQALIETGIMLGIGLISALILGGPLGILLFLTQKEQLFANRKLNGVLSWCVNLVRSFPFIILMVSVVPLTRAIAGTTIGPTAAAVPLSLAAIPYFARLVEQTLREIPKGMIEAAQAMGASPMQIVFKVLLLEARAGLISSLTLLTISFLSYTAVAGVVGGGGIGDLAIRYGYYRYETDVMIAMVLLLIIIVQCIQLVGNFFARLSDKR